VKSWRDAPLADEQKTKTKKSWRDAPLADEVAAGRAPAPAVETPASISKMVGKLPSFDIGKPGTYLPGAARAVLEVPVGLERGAADVAETVLSPLFPTGRGTVAEAERNQFRRDYGQSPIAKGGRFVGQAVMTAPVGGFLGAGAERLGLNALANSLRSGGFVTGAAPTGVFGGISNVATRALGGGVAGGTQAALVGDDATTGAVTGAALPALSVPLAKGVGSALGNFFDAATGQLGKVRASKIVQDVLGPDFDKAVQILKNAPSNVTPEQALVAGGIPPERIKGFIALGEWSAKRDPEAITDMLRTSQTAGRQALLDIIGGGETATIRRGTQEAMKKGLQARTEKIREKALDKANVVTRAVTKTEEIATEADQEAASAVEDVRRYAELEDIAGEASRHSYDPASGQKIPANYSYAARLKELAARQQDIAAKASLEAGLKRQGAESLLKNLTERGLKPLTPRSIISTLQNRLKNPTIGVPDLNKKVLKSVIGELNEWTDEKGLIDARALYEIRKTKVNDVIQEMMPNASTKAKNARAAGLLAEVKPLIDDAIEAAGGADWRKYMNEYEAGAREIDRVVLAGNAADLYRENPQKFIDMMRGRRPEDVEEIFGPGQYDIEKEMIPEPKTPTGKPATSKQAKAEVTASQARLDAMKSVAQQLEVDQKVAAQAARGYDRLQEAFRSVEPRPLGLPSTLSRAGTIANVALDKLEKRFGKDTIDTLITSMREGKGVVEAVSVLPANERNAVIRFLSGTMELKTPTAKAAAAAAGAAATKGAATAAAPPNAMNRGNQNAMRPR
jgi:hypothetical protein